MQPTSSTASTARTPRTARLVIASAFALATGLAAAQVPPPQPGASDPAPPGMGGAHGNPKGPHDKKGMQPDKAGVDKAAKPSVAEAASEPTAKKPAKSGAQAGPASGPKP